MRCPGRCVASVLLTVAFWTQSSRAAGGGQPAGRLGLDVHGGAFAVQRLASTSTASSLNLTFRTESAHQETALAFEILSVDGRVLYTQAAANRDDRGWEVKIDSPGFYGPFLVRFRSGTVPSASRSATLGHLFEDVTARALPLDSLWSSCAALADVDGDGDLDILVGQQRGTDALPLRLYINDGQGVFYDETEMRFGEVRLSVGQILFADLDRDSDADAVILSHVPEPLRSNVHVFVNDGAGKFQDETQTRAPGEPLCARSLAIGDVNGDGFPDLVGLPLFLELDSLTVLVHLNDGLGRFPDSLVLKTRVAPRYGSTVSLVDVDADSDLDLLVACIPLTVVTIGEDTTVTKLPGTNALFINDGRGHFRDETAARWATNCEDDTRQILHGDVDSDGDVDLLAVNAGFDSAKARNRLWLNDGSGRFMQADVGFLPQESVLWNNAGVLADFTGDGSPDLFLAAVEPDSGGLAPDLLFVNDGMGHFRDRSATDLPDVVDFSVDAVAGDLDGDGDRDLFVVNSGSNFRNITGGLNRVYANTSVLSSVQAETVPCLPADFALQGVYPNPFNANTQVYFALSRASQVRLAVYNLRGQCVRQLVKGVLSAGTHRVRWDGTDRAGRSLPSGVYLVCLDAGKHAAVRKVVLVR